MTCPKCGSQSKVVDSRDPKGELKGSEVRRCRECLVCGYRFSTIERLVEEKSSPSKALEMRDGDNYRVLGPVKSTKKQ